MRCALVGASGLVGGELLRLLLEAPEYEQVSSLVRRPTGVTHPRLVEVPVDFDQPERAAEHLRVDDFFCCLGTTIKKAGSQEAFARVDRDYPVELARVARNQGCTRMVIVTAVGADAESRVFYNRTKGEVEQRLGQLGFPRGLKIVRPSILLGHRNESRPAEAAAIAVARMTRGLFRGGLARYRGIEAIDVARAMLAASQRAEGGVEVFEGEPLFALAASRA